MHRILTIVVSGVMLITSATVLGTPPSTKQVLQSMRAKELREFAGDIIVRNRTRAPVSPIAVENPRDIEWRTQKAALLRCGYPCVIRDGTMVDEELLQRVEDLVKKGGRPLFVIDGWCLRTCSRFADRFRAHVCVTNRSVFGFFNQPDYDQVQVATTKGGSQKKEALVDRRSAEIKKWMTKQGVKKYGYITFDIKSAKSLWPVCSVH
jgi:hypothetical protein